MNTYRPTYTVTRTGLIIGSAYIARIRCEHANPLCGPYRRPSLVKRVLRRLLGRI